MKLLKKYFNIILIILLVLIIVFISFYSKPFSTIENIKNNELSILHLVLYSQENNYDCMYKATREYYKKFTNVKTIYYRYSQQIVNDYQLEDDILLIKGTETFIPGILNKTIKAFQYFENELDNYNYIVRSNISTIINFNILTKLLKERSFDYTGGMSGEVDNAKFIIGTGIIFSNKAMKSLIKNENLVDRSRIDDISIGLFYNKNFPEYVNDTLDPKYYIHNGENVNISDINTNQIIFYRNKNKDRNMDCEQIKKIINVL